MKGKYCSVIVICSTFNGQKYLKEQIDSLFHQSYKDFKLLFRDDGSVDGTKEILSSCNIELLFSSENLGVKKSFETLLKYASENSDAKYFVFCDQDDVWNHDKIERTLEKMHELENLYGDNIPLLVHSDLEVVNDKLETLSSAMWKSEHIYPRTNTLNKLLMQNTITGCTMMINRDLAKLCLPMSSNAIVHDWWVGLVASYFGKIGYVDDSTIKYRQHTSNTIGAKGFDIGFVLKSISKKVSLGGNISQSKGFFQQFKNELDEDTIEMLQEFISLEQKTWWQKRAVLLKYKLFKQGFIRNTGLFLKI